MLPERPQMSVKTGTVNPTSRISMATKVQAAPVTRTALRWNGVKPVVLRTSSTSRIGRAGAAISMKRVSWVVCDY
jgi:hypothetical protein